MRNATRVVTYEALASKVVNLPNPSESDTRLIKVHIQHLRAELNDSLRALATSPMSMVWDISFCFRSVQASQQSIPGSSGDSSPHSLSPLFPSIAASQHLLWPCLIYRNPHNSFTKN